MSELRWYKDTVTEEDWPYAVKHKISPTHTPGQWIRMIAWLKSNFNTNYKWFISSEMRFRNQEDAAAFRLAWATD